MYKKSYLGRKKKLSRKNFAHELWTFAIMDRIPLLVRRVLLRQIEHENMADYFMFRMLHLAIWILVWYRRQIFLSV